MSRSVNKKESFGYTMREDARFYHKHASRMYAKFGKKVMSKARRDQNRKDILSNIEDMAMASVESDNDY